MDFADLSDLGVGDVSALGICFVLPSQLLLVVVGGSRAARARRAEMGHTNCLVFVC